MAQRARTVPASRTAGERPHLPTEQGPLLPDRAEPTIAQLKVIAGSTLPSLYVSVF